MSARKRIKKLEGIIPLSCTVVIRAGARKAVGFDETKQEVLLEKSSRHLTPGEDPFFPVPIGSLLAGTKETVLSAVTS